jgi:hypothetical protein
MQHFQLMRVSECVGRLAVSFTERLGIGIEDITVSLYIFALTHELFHSDEVFTLLERYAA